MSNNTDSTSSSTGDLFPVVYQQLRDLAHAKMNREPSGHTLQTTALVHEVYLRLSKDGKGEWQNPGHFFAAAAEAMRRILVERARRHHSLKRGGGRDRVDLEFVDAAEETTDPDAMLALDQAISELKEFDERLSQVVMLRYFSGLSVEETAAAMQTSPRTVKRDWSVARAWLARKLGEAVEE
ncbi:MAG: ECF-type sigma factor [Tepidisphaeraceae bacterium]